MPQCAANCSGAVLSFNCFRRLSFGLLILLLEVLLSVNILRDSLKHVCSMIAQCQLRHYSGRWSLRTSKTLPLCNNFVNIYVDESGQLHIWLSIGFLMLFGMSYFPRLSRNSKRNLIALSQVFLIENTLPILCGTGAIALGQ